MRYIYDEQGVTFNYFLLTFIAIFLIPTTYFSLFNTDKGMYLEISSKGFFGQTFLFFEKKLILNNFITDAKLRKPSCNCEACLRKENYLKNRKLTPTNRISKKLYKFKLI